MTQPTTKQDVLTYVQENGIRFIRLWFTDILGQLKSFSINSADLEDAFEGGMGFDGSSITGFNAIEESDMIAMPDASTSSLDFAAGLAVRSTVAISLNPFGWFDRCLVEPHL